MMRPYIVNIDICHRLTCLLLITSGVLLYSNVPQTQAEQPIAKSPILTATQFQSQIEADIRGAKRLFLVVTDAGNGYSFDWAAWIAPQLEGPQGKFDLTQLKWSRAETDFGSVIANRNNQNSPIRVGGKPTRDRVTAPMGSAHTLGSTSPYLLTNKVINIRRNLKCRAPRPRFDAHGDRHGLMVLLHPSMPHSV